MLHIKNCMEEIVFNFMDEVLGDIDLCKCEKCRLDTAAIALNHLPPKYVVTEKGEIYSKVNILMQQFEVDVISAITRAAEIVKKNPKHE